MSNYEKDLKNIFDNYDNGNISDTIKLIKKYGKKQFIFDAILEVNERYSGGGILFSLISIYRLTFEDINYNFNKENYEGEK